MSFIFLSYKEATDKFEQATILDPKHASAFYNWGVALAKLCKYEEAIKQFKQAIKIAPYYSYAFIDILTQLKQGDSYS